MVNRNKRQWMHLIECSWQGRKRLGMEHAADASVVPRADGAASRRHAVAIYETAASVPAQAGEVTRVDRACLSIRGILSPVCSQCQLFNLVVRFESTFVSQAVAKTRICLCVCENHVRDAGTARG